MSPARKYDASIDVCGDILGVRSAGPVWQCPTTGSQHSGLLDALAVELYHYLSACGEAVTLDDVEADESGLTLIDAEYVREHYDVIRS